MSVILYQTQTLCSWSREAWESSGYEEVAFVTAVCRGEVTAGSHPLVSFSGQPSLRIRPEHLELGQADIT